MLAVLLLACSSSPPPSEEEPPDARKTATQAPLTIYSGRSESLVGPLFAELEKQVGFPLDVQYGKTAELATRIVSEGAESPADLFFAQDSGHLGILAARDVLAPLPEEVVSPVDPRFRDDARRWVGTSGRLRVMVYDTQQLTPEKLPKRLEDLGDPTYSGMLGWAPTNSSLHAHVSVLRNTWGEERTKTWLEAVKANEPTVYPKNSPQVAAANEGELGIGWVNHYYVHRVPKEGRRAGIAMFADGDPGNLMMASGIGVVASTDQREQAIALVTALLSEESQTYFAQESFEYPMRSGVPLHPDVAPLRPEALFDADQKHLTDLGPTRAMLQELGLL
jgi:iron(III) transport system substrate-binding protein